MNSRRFPNRSAFVTYLQSEADGQREVREFVDREVFHCVSSLIDTLSRSSDEDIANEVQEAGILEGRADYAAALADEDFIIVEADGSHYGIREDDLRRIHVTHLDHATAVEHGHAEDDGEDASGFYWFLAFPGCLPEGDHSGPFDTEDEARADALNSEGQWLAADDEDEAIKEMCESEGIEPERDEVFEHWIVSRWMAEKLSSLGEATGEVFGLTVWGRCTTGQAIHMDRVMCEVYATLHSDRYETQEQQG